MDKKTEVSKTMNSPSDLAAVKLRAVCGCGQLAIEFQTAPVAQLVCHCNDCRSMSGQPFLEVAFFPPESYKTQGGAVERALIGGSGKGKHSVQCQLCGQSLGARLDVLKGMFGALAESLDPPLNFKPLCHVWTSEKLPQTTLPEGVPAFPKGPPVAPGR